MTRDITVSDEVYRRLKRETGDQCFSELIEERLDKGGRLADVTGHKVLDRTTAEEASDVIGRLSERTVERLDDETP